MSVFAARYVLIWAWKNINLFDIIYSYSEELEMYFGLTDVG